VAGPFGAPDPEACETMKEVRAGVDEIDRMLVALITRR
jgi:chorismate mutase